MGKRTPLLGPYAAYMLAKRKTQHTHIISTTAYEVLNQTRDYLRLLAQLAEPQIKAGPDVVYVSAQALAHCFDRLADDLDRVAEAIDLV